MNSPSLFESKAIIQLTLMAPVDLSPFYFPEEKIGFLVGVYKFTEDAMVELLGPYLGNPELLRNHAFSMVVPQPDGTTIHLGSVSTPDSSFFFIELE